MSQLNVGDPVLVLDEGLAMLRKIVPDAPPNHHGWVHELCDDGDIMVIFPIDGSDPTEHSQVAPYPLSLVVPRNGDRFNAVEPDSGGGKR